MGIFDSSMQPGGQSGSGLLGGAQPQYEFSGQGITNYLQDNRQALAGMGMGLMSGNPGMSDALAGYQSGTKQDLLQSVQTEKRKQNQMLTASALAYAKNKGLNPAQTAMLMANPDIATHIIQAELTPEKPTSDMQNYQFALKNGFKGTFMDYQNSGGAAKFGLAPIPMKGKDGTIHMMQMNSQGGWSELPANGMEPVGGFNKVDTATGTMVFDKFGRPIPQGEDAAAPRPPPGTGGQPTQPMPPVQSLEGAQTQAPQARPGFIPKDIAGKAEQTELGKAKGTATVKLPDSIAAIGQVRIGIQRILTDPALDSVFGGAGFTSGLNKVPGTKEYAFQSKLDQLKAQAAQQGMDALRGLGPMSDKDLAVISEAKARIDSAQSPAALRAALMEFDGQMARATTRALQKSQGKFQPLQEDLRDAQGSPAAPAGPAGGQRRRVYNKETGKMEFTE